MISLGLKSTHRVSRAFVDPTGSHILVCAPGVGGAIALYLHPAYADARELPAMKVINCLRSRFPPMMWGSWQSQTFHSRTV